MRVVQRVSNNRQIVELLGRLSSKPILEPLTLWMYGLWKRLEADPLDPLVSKIEQNQWIIDCGAHFGFYTQLFNNVVNGSGKVLAIEPNPAALSILKRRQFREGWSNVEVSECAVWKEETTLQLGRAGPLDVTTRISTSEAPGSLRVRATTIDRLVVTYDISDLYMIMIDVEGAEFAVLKGAQTTLRNLKPIVVCEIGNDYHRDIETYCAEFFELLSQIKYTCRKMSNPAEVWQRRDLADEIERSRYLDVLLVGESV